MNSRVEKWKWNRRKLFCVDIVEWFSAAISPLPHLSLFSHSLSHFLSPPLECSLYCCAPLFAWHFQQFLVDDEMKCSTIRHVIRIQTPTHTHTRRTDWNFVCVCVSVWLRACLYIHDVYRPVPVSSYQALIVSFVAAPYTVRTSQVNRVKRSSRRREE